MDFSAHFRSGGSFGGDPRVFAQVQTFHDTTPCTVRYTAISSTHTVNPASSINPPSGDHGTISLFVEDASCGRTTELGDGTHGPTCCAGVVSHTARPPRAPEKCAHTRIPCPAICAHASAVADLCDCCANVPQGRRPCDQEGCLHVVEPRCCAQAAANKCNIVTYLSATPRGPVHIHRSRCCLSGSITRPRNE